MNKKLLLVCLLGTSLSVFSNLQHELYEAVVKNNTEKALELIRQGADFSPLSNGRSVFSRALIQSNIPIIQALLEAGYDVNVPLRDIGYPFLYVIQSNHPHRETLLTLMLDRGAHPDPENDGFGIVSLMVYPHLYQRMRSLPQFAGNDILYYLIRHNAHSFIIDTVLQRDQSIDRGEAFRYALENHHYMLADRIIHYFTSEEINGRINGRTPLSLSSEIGTTHNVELLIARGADVNLSDENGYTPLYRALIRGNETVFDLLIRNNASLHPELSNGMTLLHIAAHLGNSRILQRLVDLNENITMRDNFGNTPLHYAAQSGHVQVLPILLHAGADINAQNYQGNTPLFLTIPNWYQGVNFASRLLDAGSSLEIRNYEDLTPLDVAFREAFFPFIRLFHQHGGIISNPPYQLEQAFIEGDSTIARFILYNIRPLPYSLLLQCYDILQSYMETEDVDLNEMFYLLLEFGINPDPFLGQFVDSNITTIPSIIRTILENHDDERELHNHLEMALREHDGSIIASALRIAIGQGFVNVVRILIKFLPLDEFIEYFNAVRRITGRDLIYEDNLDQIESLLLEVAFQDNRSIRINRCASNELQTIMQTVLRNHPSYAPEFAMRVAYRLIQRNGRNRIMTGIQQQILDPRLYIEMVIFDRFESTHSEEDYIQNFINNETLMNYIHSNWRELVNEREQHDVNFLERIRMHHILNLTRSNIQQQILHLLEDPELCRIVSRLRMWSLLITLARQNRNTYLVHRFREMQGRGEPLTIGLLADYIARATAVMGILALRHFSYPG